jgi:uncharacterized protein YciI
MNELDFRKSLLAVRKQIKETQRLQAKLESHLAKIDRLNASNELKSSGKSKPN